MIHVQQLTNAYYDIWVNYVNQLKSVMSPSIIDLDSCFAPISAEFIAAVNILVNQIDFTIKPNISLAELIAQKCAIIAEIKQDDVLADQYWQMLCSDHMNGSINYADLLIIEQCGGCISYNYAYKAEEITVENVTIQYLLFDMLLATRMMIRRAQEQAGYMLTNRSHGFTNEQIIRYRVKQIMDALEVYDIVIKKIKEVINREEEDAEQNKRNRDEDDEEERTVKRRRIDWRVVPSDGLKMRFEKC